jgi:hypothetical protein
MKNISTGIGLALLAGAVLTYPFVSSLAPRANASAFTGAASAVSTSVTGQTEPTIVWYGLSTEPSSTYNPRGPVLFCAWSDGKTETFRVSTRTALAIGVRRTRFKVHADRLGIWCQTPPKA